MQFSYPELLITVRVEKFPFVAPIKKNKWRPARHTTTTLAPLAKKKQQHKSGKKQRDPLPHSCLLPGSWQFNAGVVLLCILATAALYAGDLHLGFFRIDDPQYIVTNAWIQGVTWEHIRHIVSNPYYLNYSPFHLFSYMFDHAIAGLNAYAFHLSSNLWAGIVAGFVYLVALALTQKRMTAIAAALLFIVHPAHVEAVAWISSRKDLVAAAFLLPAVLAYLKYRHSGGAIRWYAASLLLFFLSLLGKLSVTAFPAVLLALDLFIEKRSLPRALIDKIPFLFLGIFIAIAVQHAQPSTGVQADIGMHAEAFAQSLWLLTGLGNYVLYRVPPASGSTWSQLAGVIILTALFVLPLLLRKRYPLATVLIYWVLFTYLPTQILPFAYPVTDRYLFLPSVGACILIGWLIFKATEHLPKWNVAVGTALVAVISLIWVAKGVVYLAEWRDPRSVWFAATRKSDDFHVPYELGWEYLQKAGSFGTKRRNPPLAVEEAKHYASAVWKNDSRLPLLLTEFLDKPHKRPVENAFKEYLQTKAAENFDKAAAKKGTHIIPDLFLCRGVLLADKGDMQSAKKEFLAQLDEGSQLPYSEARQEAVIRAHYNLAVADEALGNSNEALAWIRLAEDEQEKLGTTVIPDLTASRKKLESIGTTLQ
jgi:protein O-mannosyl-transferase